MAFKDLNEFIRLLEAEGELIRIKEKVSPYLEITEITDRVSKANGPALLFEDVVSPSKDPVLINAFGSPDRIKMALQVKDLDDLAADIMAFMEMEGISGMMDKLKLLPKIKRLSSIFPKVVDKAPCQEVVLREKEVDLEALPALHCWPKDGGPFITMPLVATCHPRTGRRNLGMYRLQIFDKNTTGMHWHPHKGGAQHYRIAEETGVNLPASVAIGPDPACTYAATSPLPDDTDEYLLAGYLKKRPVELVKGITNDIMVPANSQYVLEGFLRPGERRIEGPFGDHTGFYSPADDYPVFHVTCMTRRKNPIYQTTLVGRPPMEDAFLGKATERLFLPIIKKQMSEVVDINLPIEGVFHNMAFISIDKRYPGHARKVIHALWGLGQMMFSKMIFIFDKEVNVQDISEVLWYLGNNVAPLRDISFVEGPLDVLDHASERPLYGSKMGVDCTGKWAEEGFGREWPEIIEMDRSVKERIVSIWSRLGIEKYLGKSKKNTSND
ncbi:MAG: menaquinone biosynthesis decarboxylase [Thermodesulfobacteriota bacterium]|nr:menaquinone biosynthesis decarboxylase [Thermodesulfobacteriota bacterium]